MNESKEKYFVYILKCLDNSYYVGFTRDLQQRTAQHASGRGGKYTSDNKVSDLVYYETFFSQSEALKREKQLKGWSKAKKEALIKGDIWKLKLLSISGQSPKTDPTSW